MKKILVALLIVALTITGCSLMDSKKNKRPKEFASGLILNYKSTEAYVTVDRPYYEINLYANKHITAGYSNLDGFSDKELTDEQFQKIVDYINSDKFLSLKEDLTDHAILDGTSTSIVIYYADGTTFKTGGLNVSNPTYNGLIELLNEYK